MALRLKALFMLAVVGLVLPVAGSPQRFCARFHAWLVPGMSCPACTDENACDCGDPAPAQPGCMIAAKMLPDGVGPDALAMPAPVAMDLPPTPAGETRPATMATAWHQPSRERAPPGDVPLFLRNRTLLL